MVVNFSFSKITIIVYSCFFLLSIVICNAQDVHLTQYYTSNLSLNPAFTGNYTGDIRVVANARNQWGQIAKPIRTNMISLEKKLYRFPDEIGLGLIVINDQVSAYNFFTNKIMVSAAYQKTIAANNFRLGIQTGMVFRSIDFSKQSFPDQWNYSQGIFDQNFSNNENSLQNSNNFLDFNVGLGWSRRFGSTKLTTGYGLFHVNKPKDVFEAADRGLPFRHVININAITSLSQKFSIMPHALFMRTAKATNFIVGANGTQMVKENLGIFLGGGYRGNVSNSDAILGVAGFIYKRLQIGFSKDFTISGLNDYAQNKSAWEFSIIYTNPSRIPGKVTIPCDRY